MASLIMAATESYHIHIDGPALPAELGRYACEVLQFKTDDFQHSMTVGNEGIARPACQLSRTFWSRSDRPLVHEAFAKLRSQAMRSGFKGFIQAEFIMSEVRFGPDQKKSASSIAPDRLGLRFKHRKIDPSLGETFKRHELHLELERKSVPSFLNEELVASGLLASPSENELSYTASGSPNAIRVIHERLISYLSALESSGTTQLRGRLISEATVKYSLHDIHPWNTPPVVDDSSLCVETLNS